MAETEDTILQNALEPKHVSGDTGSVTQHSIKDQIAAEEYKIKKTNSRRRGFPIKICRIVPPGATD